MFKDLPKDWALSKIGWACQSISVGIVIKPTQYYVDKGVRTFRSANVQEGRIKDDDWVYISEVGHQKNKKSILQENDVLVVRTGYPGTSCVVTKEFTGSNCIDIIFARPDSRKVNPFFLSEFINSELGKRQVLDKQGGLAQQHLNVQALNEVLIPLPPIPEQRKISQILATWDKAIELLEKKIALKEELRKGLMQQLLTGKKRFKEFGPEAKNGELPQGWREVRLGDILQQVSREIDWDDNAQYKLISVRRRSGGLFHRETLYGHQILTKNLYVVHAGDFLISKMQILHGASGLATEEFQDMYISGSYIACVSKEPEMLWMKYFEWLSKTPKFYHLTFLSSYGVHIEKMTFDFEDFKKRKIQLPTVQEQKAIVAVLDKMTESIRAMESKAELLKQQKKGLMQQLLTGKVRVRV